MMHKSFITDLDVCKRVWNDLLPIRNISDLWGFRLCFQRHFNYRPHFLLLEDRQGIAGLLPLTYIDDLDIFVFFPGEIWQGRSWIERTPVFFREEGLFEELLESCPENTYLRYIEAPEGLELPCLEMDEIAYVLYPAGIEFDLAIYRKRFPNKKFKQIMKVVNSFNEMGSALYFNRLEDFGFLVNMSLRQFGANSYLHDHRFRNGFRDIMRFLHDKGWLRMVSLEINGKLAAVDLGATFGETYTVFLGATHPDFLGLAKAMNMYHIEFACREGLKKLDFLCGDFHWKKLWHLDPEPLYKFVTCSIDSQDDMEREKKDGTLYFLGEALQCA